ncbi:RhoGAP domain-containing protein [Venturia nashicola]|uniref:RhoGAP-domain-containing protein n=1 Tax=Venturia nashicola TaxID=86259 RepID=A0A4Z1PTH5_9PEZI|nr:RhoGAP-domain-containing protein [Venturia nashicola]TLD39346.1 RhoGAP domain-containing protein [Venturia nashicola]
MSQNWHGTTAGPAAGSGTMDHGHGMSNHRAVAPGSQSALRPSQSNSTLYDTIRTLRDVSHPSSSQSSNNYIVHQQSASDLGYRRKRPTPLKDTAINSKLYGDGRQLSSPLSPTFSPHGSQRSPRERLEALLKSESPQDRSFTSPVPGLNSEQLAETPTDASSRSISAPVVQTLPSTTSSPQPSPSNMLPSRVDPRPVMTPRNASLDSTLSSISSSASQSARSTPVHGYKPSQDSAIIPPADIAGLIAAAGSAEAALHRLWKEKQSADSHNAQLWRLMEKQRTMIIGLNRDLEKAIKDKERYRKRLKELAAQNPSASSLRNDSTVDREQSQSPASFEESEDRRLIAKAVPSRKAAAVASSSSNGLREQLGRDLVAAPNNSWSDAVSLTSSNGGHTSLEVSPVTTTSGHVDGSQERPLSPPEEDTRSTLPSPSHIQSVPSPRTPRTPPKPLNQRQLIPALSPPESPPSPPSPRKVTPTHAPTVSITQATPIANSESFSPRSKPTMVRKTAPTPLNLSQSAIHPSVAPAPESDFDVPAQTAVRHDNDDFERGRRKTREDDDRIREAVAIAQEEARSVSKRAKKSMSKSKPPMDSPQTLEPEGSYTARNLTPGHPLSPGPAQTQLLNPEGFEGSGSTSSTTAQRGFISPPLLSPGLPSSPRPMDRPVNAPSPRQQQPSTPTPPSNYSSPLLNENPMPPFPNTAPSQASDFPGQPSPFQIVTPSAVPAPLFVRSLSAQTTSSTASEASKLDHDRLIPGSDRPSTSSNLSPAEGVYRGLMSEQHPGLLLPPNSLSSIDIKVFSSRLRPSRQSMMLPNPNEEDPVFLLGIYSRSSGKQLWRVEKTIMALPALHQQVRSLCAFDGRLPEKGLFSGHAPAKIDARRAALNAYFDTLLDTQLNDKAAFVVCEFFSTNAIGADSDLQVRTDSPSGVAPTSIDSGPPRREGYLTKRGKNFGGWKARFFVLDGPQLKYFDSPGGPRIGVIKLNKAQIGKQAHQQSNQSPMGRDDEAENQYRHAFLVLEPKRKDSSSLVRHVLCAESDEERDAWVKALMAYVDFVDETRQHPQQQQQQQQQETPVQVPRAADTQHTYNPAAHVRDAREISSRQQPAARPPPSRAAQTSEPDPSLTVQGTSYEQTVAGETPVRGPMLSSYRGNMQPMPSPTTSGSSGFSQQKQSFNISAPSNGSVIQDVGMWGNKTPAKEKKRSIFGFRGRATSEIPQSVMAPPERTAPQGRPIFGMSLAEAVECSQPVGVDVYLPAVVYRCIEYLEARSAINEEGIFRLSGSQNLIKSLRDRFNNEGDVRLLDAEYYDVHAVASLLKLYLRELPSSVLTREHHLDFLKVLDVEDKSQRVAAFNDLVHQLPAANLELLSNLCSYLADIANSADVNKMNVRNVAIVFAPTLNIPAPLIQLFLTDFSAIFGEPIEEHRSSMREITVSLPPQASDNVRSPRQQYHSDLPTPAYNQVGFGQQAAPGFQPLGASTNPNRNTFTPMRQADNGYMTPPTFNLSQGGPDSYNNNTITSSQPISKKGRRESSMMGVNHGLMNHHQTSRHNLRDGSNSRIPEQHEEQQRNRGSPERQ